MGVVCFTGREAVQSSVEFHAVRWHATGKKSQLIWTFMENAINVYAQELLVILLSSLFVNNES